MLCCLPEPSKRCLPSHPPEPSERFRDSKLMAGRAFAALADRKTGSSSDKTGITGPFTCEHHGQGAAVPPVSMGALGSAGPSGPADLRSWAGGEDSDKRTRTRRLGQEHGDTEEEEEEEEDHLVREDDTDSDDSSTSDAVDAMADGSGLERALPTIHFSCRSSVRDGIDTEFEVTSDSSSSSLCSVSGARFRFRTPQCQLLVLSLCSTLVLSVNFELFELSVNSLYWDKEPYDFHPCAQCLMPALLVCAKPCAAHTRSPVIQIPT
jgi:hypothetical protein